MIIRGILGIAALLFLAGCSMQRMAVRGSLPLMEGGIEAMNRETDIELAKAAMPASMKMIEGMDYADPDNARVRLYAAEGFHGYAFAFVEPEDADRAAGLYARCRDHARAALRPAALRDGLETLPVEALRQEVARTGPDDVPALFWTASCWAKWVQMNLDDVTLLPQVERAAILMRRVLELDEGYYYAGPHLFFAAFHAVRGPVLGGDFAKSEAHFERARELTGGRVLMVDVLQAEFLDRQRLDRAAFHARLTRVLEAPDDLLPEATFINRVAKAQARRLLAGEDEWF
jgi:hypothetical protein